MRKAMRNYWLDVVMGLLGAVLSLSSLLLWVIFPRGYYPSRVLWVAIHKWVGLALAIVVAFHLALHWGWLKRMTRRHLGRLCRVLTGSRSHEDGPPVSANRQDQAPPEPLRNGLSFAGMSHLAIIPSEHRHSQENVLWWDNSLREPLTGQFLDWARSAPEGERRGRRGLDRSRFHLVSRR